MSYTLQSDIYPGMVHQGEHGAKPGAFLANQFRLRIVKDKLTGWRAVNAQLFLDPSNADMIASTLNI